MTPVNLNYDNPPAESAALSMVAAGKYARLSLEHLSSGELHELLKSEIDRDVKIACRELLTERWIIKNQTPDPNMLVGAGVELVGTVRRFDDSRGLGIIEEESGGTVFVHWTGILGDGHRTLAAGDPVAYFRVRTERGMRAVNVRKF